MSSDPTPPNSARGSAWKVLTLILLAVAQVAVGGANAVDGNTLALLFRDPASPLLPPTSQYVLDSPLPIAIGHWLGVDTLAGVALLSALFAVTPLIALLALRFSRRISTAQAISIAAITCVTPFWRTLFEYLGKSDGLTLTLVLAIILLESPVVLVMASCLLVANHMQQGVAILFLLALVSLRDRAKAVAFVVAAGAGFLFARALQAVLGIGEHAGRVDYLIDLLSRRASSFSYLLLVAAVGALGGGWLLLIERLRQLPITDRVLNALALIAALGLGAIAVDNSRDMFLLCFPILLWNMRSELKAGTLELSHQSLALLALPAIVFPDVMGGVRRLSPWGAFAARVSVALRGAGGG